MIRNKLLERVEDYTHLEHKISPNPACKKRHEKEMGEKMEYFS